MLSRMTTLLILTIAYAWTGTAHADTYYVYFLAGQSNMDGYGLNTQLPVELRGEVENVRIYLSKHHEDGKPAEAVGLWTALRPGFGTRAQTDGNTVQHSDRFGPELTFARHIRELRPDEKVAIIKYARGGTSIDTRPQNWGAWDPHDTRGEGKAQGINQYDHALATIDAALNIRDIDGDGEEDTLIPAGIVWMQGETDGTHEEAAKDYGDNLAELAELFRAALRKDDLPFVFGRISDSKANDPSGKRVWPFGDEVRGGQHDVAERDPHAEIVTTTDNYEYSDPYHYDTEGYIDLGIEFAKAMHELRSREDD